VDAKRHAARPVTWSRPVEALVLFVCGRTARTAVPVAVVVGTVLSAVNQGHLLLDGGDAATWIRVAINYLVPYCVASVGFLSARRVPLPPAGPARPDR
jgi:hypothetical protein